MEELDALDEDVYARLIAEYETAQRIAAITQQEMIEAARQS